MALGCFLRENEELGQVDIEQFCERFIRKSKANL
jgi:hypothetical protein